MRLLHVIDSLDGSGGAENALATLASHWSAAGHYVTVVALKERESPLTAVLQEAGVEVLFVHKGSVGNLASVIRERNPDVVHTSLFQSDVRGRVAARLARTPCISSLVATGYGADHYRSPGLRPWRVAGAHGLDALTGTLTTRFHAVSNHCAAVMRRRLGIPASKITVIPRGKDPARLGLPSEERRLGVRASLSIGPESVVVLAAARHEWPKGLDLLLKSVPFLRARHPDVRVLIAGREGASTAHLRELIRVLSLDEHVRLLGTRADVPDLIVAADVVVVPSRREGISNVAIESMFLRTPIVGTDTPAIRETVGGDQHAVLVPQEPSAVAAGVDLALTRASDMTSEALGFAERMYDVDVVARSMLRLYGELATSPGGRR
jgi:glycosyltransferase involved in cell wall biosynthesis